MNDKLRDVVSGQAGIMLSILLSTVTGLITSGFAIFNVLTLAVVTPILGFYFLRDWPQDDRMIVRWVPRRYRDVIRRRRGRWTGSCPPGCAARRCAA